jgi:hypothetical protein
MTDVDEATRRVEAEAVPMRAAAPDEAAASPSEASAAPDEAGAAPAEAAVNADEAAAAADESAPADTDQVLATATAVDIATDSSDEPRSAADAGVTANPEATQEVPQPYEPPAAIRLEELEAAGQTAIWPWPTPAAESSPVAAVAATAVASPAELSTAAAGRERRKRVQLRTSVTILLFLAGVAVGVVGLRFASLQPAPVAPDGFPTLERTAGEPIQAGAVAHELAVNDVQGLAQLLDSDTLTALQTQLRPLVSFESVTFVGATSFDHDTFAGYVVRGRDSDGTLGLVGLVIRLRDGQVVAQ